MIQTTLAYVGDFLGKFFFEDYEGDYKRRVVYGDNDSYFKELYEHRLVMPGLCFNLSQLNLPHGPSKPTSFRGDDNAGGTKNLVFNAKQALLTCSLAIYCQDAMQSFKFMQRYLELQHHAVVPVTYWATDEDCIVVDCALSSFEDMSIPPMGRKSGDQDSTGLIYELEAGFTVPSLFLETYEGKLVRCIRFSKAIMPIDNSSNIYTITDEEYTDTTAYLNELDKRKESNNG